MSSINPRKNLIYILFPIMFGYIYFLAYSPIKVNDDQLLIITIIFTLFVVIIPVFSFSEFDIEEPLSTKNNEKNKKTKDSKQKQQQNKDNFNNKKTNDSSFVSKKDKWYKILESSPDNTDAQIKSNFRRLAKKYHPDIIQGKNLDKDFEDLATKKFKEINDAYENIKQIRKT